jgi:hypothetical protein
VRRLRSTRTRTVPWFAPKTKGTRIRFRVSRKNPPRLATLFERFCPQSELRFTHTEVAVRLLLQTDGSLVLRSQAKRLMLGLDKFESARLDVAGVNTFGQGFADEVFRVWARAHPSATLHTSGMQVGVLRMLRHVGAAG